MSRMPHRFLALVLALLVPLAQAQAPAAAPEAEPIVDLPDFTRLVERAGPAVVNIEATLGEIASFERQCRDLLAGRAAKLGRDA